MTHFIQFQNERQTVTVAADRFSLANCCRFAVKNEEFIQLRKQSVCVLNMSWMSVIFSNTFSALKGRLKNMCKTLVHIGNAQILAPCSDFHQQFEKQVGALLPDLQLPKERKQRSCEHIYSSFSTLFYKFNRQTYIYFHNTSQRQDKHIQSPTMI